MKEKWKEAVGLDGFYEISNQGRVRSIRFGNRILKSKINHLGYRVIKLNGKTWFIHRLILEAFVELKPKGFECGHLNGIRSDNRIENLKWITPKENQSHRIIHGTACRGETIPWSKVTEVQVIEIRALKECGIGTKFLSEKYGMTFEGIRRIADGRNWKHIA